MYTSICGHDLCFVYAFLYYYCYLNGQKNKLNLNVGFAEPSAAYIEKNCYGIGKRSLIRTAENKPVSRSQRDF